MSEQSKLVSRVADQFMMAAGRTTVAPGDMERAKTVIALVNVSAQNAHNHIQTLEADLYEVLEFLKGYEDVIDGDYGEPAPNRAMSLANTIRESLGL